MQAAHGWHRGIARRPAVLAGVVALLAVAAAPLAGLSRPASAGAAPESQASQLAQLVARASVTKNVQVSTCGGQNAEVEEALHGPDVYVEWIGCGGIGFSRSTDGGRIFGPSVVLPGSTNTHCGVHGCADFSWDPAITVSSSGLVYASFMHVTAGVSSPVVDVSSNDGQTFPQSVALPVPTPVASGGNWGDRDFIAVGPDGTVYVTWDYGPSAAELKIVCSPIGSCSFTHGDLNAVFQKSTDGGKTWTALTAISPHFPLGGADIAPIIAQPNGTLDVVYQAFPTNSSTLALSPGHEYFTRSTDGGATWSAPIRLGPSAGTVSLTEWWIDGAIGTDPAGDLYATWDTQSRHDIGWLAVSTDGGARWSAPIRVTDPRLSVEQLVESTGVGRGLADVAWQTPTAKGYATFVRTYSIRRGWLEATPFRVSTIFGEPTKWPGDTFGIAPVPGGRATAHGVPVLLTWGTASSHTANDAEIYEAVAAP